MVLPDSVITIGSQAFYDAEYLKEIDLGKGVQNIGDLAFAYSKLSEVTIPGSVQKMEGRDTFAVIGATIADNFGVEMPDGTIGESVLSELL